MTNKIAIVITTFHHNGFLFHQAVTVWCIISHWYNIRHEIETFFWEIIEIISNYMDTKSPPPLSRGNTKNFKTLYYLLNVFILLSYYYFKCTILSHFLIPREFYKCNSIHRKSFIWLFLWDISISRTYSECQLRNRLYLYDRSKLSQLIKVITS